VADTSTFWYIVTVDDNIVDIGASTDGTSVEDFATTLATDRGLIVDDIETLIASDGWHKYLDRFIIMLTTP
jgi:hypothetical protein